MILAVGTANDAISYNPPQAEPGQYARNTLTLHDLNVGTEVSSPRRAPLRYPDSLRGAPCLP